MSNRAQGYFWILLFLLLGINVSYAQFGDKPKAKEKSSRDEVEEEIIDTVKLRYFTIADLESKFPRKDTLLNDFEKYASVRSFRKGALTLGNLGSSHLNIFYNPKENILTDPGFHQYDNYKLQLEDFKFYELGQAYNNLFFSPVGGQSRFQVEAEFARNFANNVHVTLDLSRISQEGFYREQNTKSTSFGLGIWKNNEAKNHQLFLTLIGNNHNEQHNGGIITPSLPPRFRSTENSFLTDANTRHQHFTYSLDNFFQLKSGTYSAHHQIRVDQGYFRYGDDDTANIQDSLYNNYLTDPKGVRYFLGFNRFMNTLDIGLNTKYIDLTLGLKYHYSRFRSDAGLSQIHDLFAFSKIKLELGSQLDLNGLLEIGAGENVGNLKLNGLLEYKPFKSFKFSSYLKILRYDPALVNEEVSISFVPVITNDFAKINEVFLGGNILWEKINLELEFNSGLIDKPVFYNQMAEPEQLDGTTEYYQAILNHKLHWKFIGIENAVLFQKFTDNVYHLPETYSVHNLYLEKRLFKKNLLARIGILYYNIHYDGGLGFLPITGSFYQTEKALLDYPYTELYTNFK